MKKILFVLFVFTCQACSSSPQVQAGSAASNEHSYAVGHLLAQHYRKLEIPLDMPAFSKGFSEGFTEESSEEKRQQMTALVHEWMESAKAERDRIREERALRNREAAEQWLAEKREEPGITAFESGLLLERVNPVDGGQKPGATDQITFEYESFRLDGTRFDGSEEGAPVTAEMAALMPGLREAVSQMALGERARLYIPAELGYGDQGYPGVLEPGELHIVEVTLKKIAPGSRESGHHH